MKLSRGSEFFRNVSMLMVFFPITSLLWAIFKGVGMLGGFIHIEDFASSTGLVHIAVIVFSIGTVFQIIVGIFGMKAANDPGKMNTCILFGIIILLFYAASQIIDYAGGGVHDTLDYIGMISGLLIPAFFIASAVQTKAGE